MPSVLTKCKVLHHNTLMMKRCRRFVSSNINIGKAEIYARDLTNDRTKASALAVLVDCMMHFQLRRLRFKSFLFHLVQLGIEETNISEKRRRSFSNARNTRKKKKA